MRSEFQLAQGRDLAAQHLLMVGAFGCREREILLRIFPQLRQSIPNSPDSLDIRRIASATQLGALLTNVVDFTECGDVLGNCRECEVAPSRAQFGVALGK